MAVRSNVVKYTPPNGKPYLKHYPTFNFNISYSGNYIICAISEVPIGIDIEQIKYINYKKIAQSVFSTNEFEYITNSNVSIQLDRFYEIWTLKESFIKCCGKGLGISLKSFSINIDKDENVKVVNNDKYTEYSFMKLDMKQGYKISVCSMIKENLNSIIIIYQNDLINNYLRLV